MASGASGRPTGMEGLNEEEEEDELVKAIMRSKDLHRDHPPAIAVEDYIVDVCFHPTHDRIALASITGDILMWVFISLIFLFRSYAFFSDSINR